MLTIDSHNILGYGNVTESHKQYTITIGSIHYHGPDRDIFVIHKKSLKLIPIKNLGDDMEIIAVYPQNSVSHMGYDIALIDSALMFNPSYNEETGSLNYFLPSTSYNQISHYQSIYDHYVDRGEAFVLGQDQSVRFSPSEIRRSYPGLETIGERVSFWCGLRIVYGQTQATPRLISSVRRQIPLVGDVQTKLHYLQDTLDGLLSAGYIISSQLLESGKYPILQVITHDYELIDFLGRADISVQNLSGPLEIPTKIRMKEEVSQRKSSLKSMIDDQNLVDDIGLYDLRWKLIKK